MTRPLCVLDANIVISDRRLRGAVATAFLRALARGEIDAAVPQVAFDEAVNNFADGAAAQARAVKEVRKGFGALGVPWDQEFDAAGATTDYRDWLMGVLREHDVAVLPLVDAPHETLVEWDIGTRKPFKPGGKGYRDALIWFSVLGQSHERDVYFVTENAADFAVSRKVKNQLAPELLADVEALGGGAGTVRLIPSLSDLLEVISGEEPDVVASLNTAFETGRPLRASFLIPLKEAILESQTYNLEVDDASGPVVEILPEVVHEPITLDVERATPSGPNTYLIRLYVEADVDVHVTWTKPDSEFASYGVGHYESEGTTATLWFTVDATYDRSNDTFQTVGVWGSANGTITIR